MNHLRIIVWSLCLVGCTRSHTGRYNLDQVFKAPGIGLGDKENSEKAPEGPNGLDNNGLRCYANATLQLLAACFAQEIKSLPRYPEDTYKRQLRDNLLMIVDHINAKEQKKTNDGRILQAVRDLTTSIGTTDGSGGGTAVAVILSLDDLLAFIPKYTVLYHTRKLLSDGSVCDMQSWQTNFCPHRSQIITYRSSKVVDRLPLNWEKASKLIQPSSETVRNLVQSIRTRLRQTLEQTNPRRGKAELEHVVEFSRLEGKLHAGSKLVLYNGSRERGPLSSITFYGASVYFPYSKDLKKRQKFDLVGVVVHIGFHYVAYVKRKGIWYLVNDARVSKVSEKEMSRLFECWRKEDEKNKTQWDLKDFPAFMVYEARY